MKTLIYMHRQFKLMIFVNVILILFFVLAEYGIGNELNSYPNDLHYISWSPFVIQDVHAGALINGNWVPVGSTTFTINFPFWLFFVAIAVNLYFMFRLQRGKETKQNPS
jgi:hypothetical protein